MHSFIFWDNLFSSFDSALQILDMDLDPDDQDFNSNEEGNNEVRFVKYPSSCCVNRNYSYFCCDSVITEAYYNVI